MDSNCGIRKDAIKIGWVELFVTEDCNLSCKYCFHKKEPKSMSESTLDKTLEFLAQYLTDDCVFSFFGGEPLLREDFVLQSSKKIRALFPKSKFFMSTNATIFSEQIAKLAADDNFTNIQISYDGLSQDVLRGSGELVRENIRKYIATAGIKKINARMTFTPETVANLCSDVENAYEVGFRSIMHNAEYSDKWKQEDVEQYRVQLDKIYEFAKDKSDLNVVFADCNASVANNPDKRCSAGKQMISVSADGWIYPCHRAVAYEEFRIGNVYDGKLNRGIFIGLRMNGCSGCEAVSTCHSCFMANYEYNKSLKTPLKCACDINIIEHKKAVQEFDGQFGENSIPTMNAMIRVLEDILDTNKQILKGVS